LKSLSERSRKRLETSHASFERQYVKPFFLEVAQNGIDKGESIKIAEKQIFIKAKSSLLGMQE
jgi:hypothetical protein